MAKKNAPNCWQDLVTVRSRYRRSVHLERDATAEDALSGYVLTPLVRRVLHRVVDGLTSEPFARAWSLTGPYGSGKSAFALFLTNALAATGARQDTAHQLLRTVDASLVTKLRGIAGETKRPFHLAPILITGERAPLEVTVLRALERTASQFWPRGKKPPVVGEITDLLQQAEGGQRIGTKRTVELLEEFAVRMRDAKKGAGECPSGLLVVLDEAGKFLEYASQNPGRADIQLLQELAEAANRSAKVPIVFITLLHQGFERYAKLGSAQRNDWGKVQGRFEDIAFLEPVAQIVRLIAGALDHGSTKTRTPASLRKRVRDLAETVAGEFEALTATDAEDFLTALADTLPLHPVTSLLLGPVFRGGLSQNERSLFAFLAANEPGGLQAFLQESRQGTVDEWPLFGPDDLYDYISTNWGTRLFGLVGRRWALVDDALRRLPAESGSLEATLVKTIGLLGVAGSTIGALATDKLLRSVAGVGSRTTAKQYERAIASLKSSSLIVYRKFKDAYQIWEGSDLDLDALLHQTMQRTDMAANVLREVERAAPPRPIVAKRHLMETGTLRYFSVHYGDDSMFPRDRGAWHESKDADGTIWIVLTQSETARSYILGSEIKGLSLTAEANPVVFCLPAESGTIRNLALESAALQSILAQSSELHGDPAAQREVQTRLAETQEQLRRQVEALWTGDSAATWICPGIPNVPPPDATQGRHFARRLNGYLSNILEKAFAEAPRIQNELLNRRSISSPAAAARRNLLEAMVQQSSEPQLGITGTPPEMALYRSVVGELNLHRQGADGWHFVATEQARGTAIHPVWERIDKLLADAERAKSRTSIVEIYEQLARPPFGIKAGLLPVLLLAYITALSDEVALYEDGRFAPEINGALVERLGRSPGRFEIQRYRITGSRSDVFASLRELLVRGEASKNRERQLVPIVRALVQRVAALSDYARRTTLPDRSDPEASRIAVAVRDTLARADDPHRLIFSDLPVACGEPPIVESARADQKATQRFIVKLRTALEVLFAADASLLRFLQEELAAAFDSEGNLAEIRKDLGYRAQRVEPILADSEAVALCRRLADTSLTDEKWMASIATLLSGKQPKSWIDTDLNQFGSLLAIRSQRFRAFEDLVDLSKQESGDSTGFRIAIARPGQAEIAQLVILRAGDQIPVERCTERLTEELGSFAGDYSASQRIAALAKALEAELERLRASSGRSKHKPGAEA